MTLLGGLAKGLVFVLSAPAGTGKTTLVRMLTEEFHSVVQSISYTTRKMRHNEIDGRDYHFISEAEFERMIQQGAFLEYARVFGYYYGTSKETIEQAVQKGKHIALVIDTQGAMALQKTIDAVYIFIRPPNLEELKKRLHGRKSDTLETIDTRLSWAAKELQAAESYDYLIVNEDLLIAYQILRAIFIAEEHKNRLK